MSDFTKKSGNPGIRVDHKTGLIHIPGKDPLPLLTHLSPSEQREADSLQSRRNKIMIDNMGAFFKCPQCGKITPGYQMIVKWNKIEGVQSEFLHCPHPGIHDPSKICDAPCSRVPEMKA